jgi:hypothetical protein
MIISLRNYAGTTELIMNIWQHCADMGHGAHEPSVRSNLN